MKFADKVFLMRDAGVVKRSHTCRTLVDRNVAEHSHGVAMLVLLLYAEAGVLPRPELLAAALTHDLSEIATGDTPAPVKREHPALKQTLNAISTKWEQDMGVRYHLTQAEEQVLLWCDRMDFALYAFEEVQMGNKYFYEYLHRILGWLHEMPYPLPGTHPPSATAAAELLSTVTLHAYSTI
jgi:5'-deoxynucleotidase YfbR-like HD superfamily hydrolase